MAEDADRPAQENKYREGVARFLCKLAEQIRDSKCEVLGFSAFAGTRKLKTSRSHVTRELTGRNRIVLSYRSR